MKILHVYKTYLPDTYGGVEQVVKTISNETSKFNCTSTLLTLSLNPTQPNEFPNLNVELTVSLLNRLVIKFYLRGFQ